jgi:thymidylate kinase
MTRARLALAGLERAGIDYCIRNAPGRVDDPEAGADIDVLVRPPDLPAVTVALHEAGFHHLAAGGHPGHRFFVVLDEGRWVKLDVIDDLRYGRRRVPVGDVIARRGRDDGLWVASPDDEAAHARQRRDEPLDASGSSRVLRALRRRRPLSWRRLGPLVAILGPDGAGKSTVIDDLEKLLPVGVTRLYLGTGRGGAGGQSPATPQPAPPRPVRETAFVVRKALRAWRRLATGYAAAWRGHVVLCDRHPVEVLAIRPPRAPIAARVERALVGRLTPRPDAIVLLDAPGEVLFERKGEHSAPALETWRRAYHETFMPAGATVVSTAGSRERAVADASAVVWDALARRRRW